MGDIVDLDGFRNRKHDTGDDPALDKRMKKAEKDLRPAAATAWERVSAASVRIFDPQEGVATLSAAVRRFWRPDADVALLTFAGMIVRAAPADRDELRSRFIEAFISAHQDEVV
jgi:thioredoxin-like negative regulator of GroEL